MKVNKKGVRSNLQQIMGSLALKTNLKIMALVIIINQTRAAKLQKPGENACFYSLSLLAPEVPFCLSLPTHKQFRERTSVFFSGQNPARTQT
jgi:hypothetical protein